jgi:hypothetical protein
MTAIDLRNPTPIMRPAVVSLALSTARSCLRFALRYGADLIPEEEQSLLTYTAQELEPLAEHVGTLGTDDEDNDTGGTNP